MIETYNLVLFTVFNLILVYKLLYLHRKTKTNQQLQVTIVILYAC